MPEMPAFPLFIDSYMLDCGHLSDAEHGRYLQILMQLWIAPQQRLPNDDDWLARKFRRSPDEIRRDFRPLLAEFCQSDGNWIRQKRLCKVFAEATARRKKQSDRAKSRWNKEKDICPGNAKGGTAAAMPPSQAKPSQESSTVQQQPPVPPPRDEFEALDAALRRIPGVEKHPIFAVADISAIWRLRQQGFDLQTQIAPIIRDRCAKAKRPIKTWSYFSEAIMDSAKGRSAEQPQAVSREVWLKRLDYGRRNSTWDLRWCPMPGKPGCEVPDDLLQPGDGNGWSEWRSAA